MAQTLVARANAFSVEVDVAVAELGEERDQGLLARLGFGSRARAIGASFTVDAAGAIQEGKRVYKAGRTTGWTEGRVSALGVVSSIAYTGGPALFRNQLAISASNDNGGPSAIAATAAAGFSMWTTNLWDCCSRAHLRERSPIPSAWS